MIDTKFLRQKLIMRLVGCTFTVRQIRNEWAIATKVGRDECNNAAQPKNAELKRTWCSPWLRPIAGMAA